MFQKEIFCEVNVPEMEGFHSGTKADKRTGACSARGCFLLERRIKKSSCDHGLQELVQEEEENSDTEEEPEYEIYEEEESRRGSIVEGFSIEDS